MESVLLSVTSPPLQKLLRLLEEDQLNLYPNSKGETSSDLPNAINVLGKTNLPARLTEDNHYGDKSATLEVHSGDISLADLSEWLNLNPHYKALYEVLHFSDTRIEAYASEAHDHEYLTITGKAVDDGAWNLMGIPLEIDGPIRNVELSVQLTHQLGSFRKHYHVTVTADLCLQEDQSIKVEMSMPVGQTGVWGLRLLPPGISVSLSTLKQLFLGDGAGQAHDQIVAKEQEQSSDTTFSLDYFTVRFTPALTWEACQFHYLDFSVSSEGAWSLLNDQIVLKSLGFQMALTNDTSGLTFQGNIQGKVDVGPVEVTANIDLPLDQVTLTASTVTSESGEPLQLHHFDALMGGNALTQYLPQSLKEADLALTLHQMKLVWIWGKTSLDAFALNFELTSEKGWAIWPDHLTFYEFNLDLDVSEGTSAISVGGSGAIEQVAVSARLDKDREGHWEAYLTDPVYFGSGLAGIAALTQTDLGSKDNTAIPGRFDNLPVETDEEGNQVDRSTVLRQFRVHFETEPSFEVSYVSVFVETKGETHIVPDKLLLLDTACILQVNNPFSGYEIEAAQLGGQLQLGDHKIRLVSEKNGANAHWVFKGQSQPGDEISFTAILEKLLKTIGVALDENLLPELTVRDLALIYTPAIWGLTFSGKSQLELTEKLSADLTIDLDFAGKSEEESRRQLAFTGSGKFRAGGAIFSVTAAYTKAASEGWSFAADMEGTASFTSLMNDVLGVGGVDFPDELPLDFTLRDVRFRSQPSVKYLLLEGTGALTLELFEGWDLDLEVDAYIERFSTAGLQIDLEARATLALEQADGSELELQMLVRTPQEGSGWILTGAVTEGDLTLSGLLLSLDKKMNVGLSGLMDTLKQGNDDIPDILDPQLISLTITFDQQEKTFNVQAVSDDHGTLFISNEIDEATNDRVWLLGLQFPQVGSLSELPAVGTYLGVMDFISLEQTTIAISSQDVKPFRLPDTSVLLLEDTSDAIVESEMETALATLGLLKGVSVVGALSLKAAGNDILQSLDGVSNQEFIAFQANLGASGLRLRAFLSADPETGEGSMNLSGLLDAFDVGLDLFPDTLLLSRLTLDIHTGEGRFYSAISLQGTWDVSAGYFPLILKEMHSELDITWKGQKNMIGHLKGKAALAGADFQVATHFELSSKQLVLEGRSIEGAELSLKRLAEEIMQGTRLPEEVPEVLLYDLSFLLDKGTGRIAVKGSSKTKINIPVGDNLAFDLDTHLQLITFPAPKGNKRHWHLQFLAELNIEGHRFDLIYEYSETSHLVSGHWQPASTGLSISGLIKLLELGSIDLPDFLDASITDVQFVYQVREKYFRFQAVTASHGSLIVEISYAHAFRYVFAFEAPTGDLVSQVPVLGDALTSIDFMPLERVALVAVNEVRGPVIPLPQGKDQEPSDFALVVHDKQQFAKGVNVLMSINLSSSLEPLRKITTLVGLDKANFHGVLGTDFRARSFYATCDLPNLRNNDLSTIIVALIGQLGEVPALSIAAAEIKCLPFERYFLLHMKVTAGWDLSPGLFNLYLQEIETRVVIDNSSVAGTLSGKLLIAEIDFSLATTLSSAEGLVFEGKAANERDISLTQLYRSLADRIGAEVPFDLPEVQLYDLKLRYASRQSSLRISAKSRSKYAFPFLLGDLELDAGIELSAYVDKTTRKRVLSYTMISELALVKGHVLTLAYEKSAKRQMILGSWRQEESEGLGVSDLIEVFVDDNLDLPEALDPQLVALVLSYDVMERTFALQAKTEDHGTIFLCSDYDPYSRKRAWILGLQYPLEKKLSNLPEVGQYLKMTDFLELDQITIAVSSANVKRFRLPDIPDLETDIGGSLPVSQSPTLTKANMTLSKGLNVLGVLDLQTPNDEILTAVNKFCKADYMVLQGGVSPSNIRLRAYLEADLKIPSGEVELTFTDPFVDFYFLPAFGASFGGSVAFDINVLLMQEEENRLIAEGALAITTTEVSGRLHVSTENPEAGGIPNFLEYYGIYGVEFHEMGMILGYSFISKGVKVGFQSTFSLGDQASAANEITLVAEFIYVGKAVVPNIQYVSFQVDELSLAVMLQTFIHPEVYSNVPEFPSFINELNVTDLNFYYCYQPTLLPDGTMAAMGLGAGGNANLFGWKCRAQFNLNFHNGINGHFQLSPIDISIDGTELVAVTGEGETVNAYQELRDDKWYDITVTDESKFDESKPQFRKRTIVDAGGAVYQLDFFDERILFASLRVDFLDTTVGEVYAVIGRQGMEFQLLYKLIPGTVITLDSKLKIDGADTFFYADGDFTLRLQDSFSLSLDTALSSIPGVPRIDLIPIDLDTDFEGHISFDINKNGFSMEVSGNFQFQGVRYNMPTLILNVPVSTLKNLPDLILDWIKEQAVEIFKDLLQECEQIAEAAYEAMKDIMVETEKAIQEVSDEVEEAVHDVVDASIQIITNREEAAAAIEEETDKAMDMTEGVLRDLNEKILSKNKEVDQVITGLRATADVAVNTAREVVLTIADEAEEYVTTITREINDIRRQAIKTAERILSEASRWVRNTITRGSNAVVSAGRSIYNKVKGLFG